MIHFTADLHLGHKAIIEYTNRPFKSVQEMDREIINKWAATVAVKDDVYILGDFCLCNPDYYVDQLCGNIFFIPGGHDNQLPKENSRITHCPPIYEFYPDGLFDEYENPQLIVLCHYSMRSWNKSHYASWHLFGHHHGNYVPWGLSFDVGVDTNNFFPYTLSQVSGIMKTLKPIVDFRRK